MQDEGFQEVGAGGDYFVYEHLLDSAGGAYAYPPQDAEDAEQGLVQGGPEEEESPLILKLACRAYGQLVLPNDPTPCCAGLEGSQGVCIPF